ncbi:hypothetical protein C8R44DRAFT_724389 [Mycena epipterygia]|nr:hypothetical protein C8R44DRAFT_724389 [Mycena epipterygia]
MDHQQTRTATQRYNGLRNPEDVCLPVLRGSSELSQINACWKPLRRRVELGDQNFTKYQTEYREGIAPNSPASIAPEIYRPIAGLETEDERLRYVYLNVPHHSDMLSEAQHNSLSREVARSKIMHSPSSLLAAFPNREAQERPMHIYYRRDDSSVTLHKDKERAVLPYQDARLTEGAASSGSSARTTQEAEMRTSSAEVTQLIQPESSELEEGTSIYGQVPANYKKDDEFFGRLEDPRTSSLRSPGLPSEPSSLFEGQSNSERGHRGLKENVVPQVKMEFQDAMEPTEREGLQVGTVHMANNNSLTLEPPQSTRPVNLYAPHSYSAPTRQIPPSSLYFYPTLPRLSWDLPPTFYSSLGPHIPADRPNILSTRRELATATTGEMVPMALKDLQETIEQMVPQDLQVRQAPQEVEQDQEEDHPDLRARQDPLNLQVLLDHQATVEEDREEEDLRDRQVLPGHQVCMATTEGKDPPARQVRQVLQEDKVEWVLRGRLDHLNLQGLQVEEEVVIPMIRFPPIKAEVKPEALPEWDGASDTAILYFWKMSEAMGFWLWTRLKAGSKVQKWYMMLPEVEQNVMKQNHTEFLRGVKEGFLGRLWQLEMLQTYENQKLREKGHTSEDPAEFLLSSNSPTVKPQRLVWVRSN